MQVDTLVYMLGSLIDTYFGVPCLKYHFYHGEIWLDKMCVT